MTLHEGPAWKAFNRSSPTYDGLMPILEGYLFAWNKPTYAVSKIPSISFPFPYGDGHVYGDRSVANAFKISVNITPRRPSDNNTKAWVTYNAMTQKIEDHCNAEGYISDTDDEAPVCASGYVKAPLKKKKSPSGRGGG
ncbi:hypothetical protein C0991_010387, partial [Blastosporella zonata]